MNYYQRNVGDFIKATLSLTLVQRGAYSALLDIYYSEEKPLPVDEREVQDLAIVRSKAERDAVSFVLRRFFELRDDGWHQKRADEEIAAYHVRVEQARENGASGGRPKKPKGNRPGLRIGTDEETDPVCGSKANQNHNQNQIASVGIRQPTLDQGPSGPLSGKPDLVGEKPDAKAEKTRALRAEGVAIIAFLNEKTGKQFPPTEANVGEVVARLREGFTPIQIRQVIVMKAREWRNDADMRKYLRPDTLFGRKKFSNYVGELVDEVDDQPTMEGPSA